MTALRVLVSVDDYARIDSPVGDITYIWVGLSAADINDMSTQPSFSDGMK